MGLSGEEECGGLGSNSTLWHGRSAMVLCGTAWSCLLSCTSRAVMICGPVRHGGGIGAGQVHVGPLGISAAAQKT